MLRESLANIMTFKAEPKGTERKANMIEDGYSVKSGDNVPVQQKVIIHVRESYDVLKEMLK